MSRPETKGSAKLSHAGKLLTLIVKGKATLYVVEDLRPDKRVADPAFRLTKEDGVTYDVHKDKHGIHCSCADATYVREKRGGLCKHAKSLMACGLMGGK